MEGGEGREEEKEGRQKVGENDRDTQDLGEPMWREQDGEGE